MNNLVKNLQSFKLITFDVTETLLYFKQSPSIEYANVAKEFGYKNIDMEKIVRNFSPSFKYMTKMYPNYGRNSIKWEEWWHQLIMRILNNSMITSNSSSSSRNSSNGSSGSSISIDDQYKISRVLIDRFQTAKCWSKAVDVDCLLDKIKLDDKKLGIISNFDPRLPVLLKNILLFDKFDFILTSYDIGVEKPNKEIFNKALDIANLSDNPSGALHIGNTPALDYTGAKLAGWHSILITNDSTGNWQKKYANDGINLNHTFSSISELLDKLETDIIKW